MLDKVRLWIRSIRMAENSGRDLGEAVGAIILGIVGGLALGAIIEAVTKPKCPVCHNTIEKETIVCPHCSSWLQWSPW